MSTVVVCGGSYNDFDDRYPGLHWASRLTPHEVYILARGGASNFSIWHQIRHCVEFKPDVLLVCFTSCPRVEFLKTSKIKSVVTNTVWPEDRQWHYRNAIFDSVDHALPNYNHKKFVSWMPYYVEEYDILKNFLYIKSALEFLDQQKINYYFSLGDFETYLGQEVTGIPIDFAQHQHRNLLPNPATHPEHLQPDPYFHISDANWHAAHAELVKSLIPND